MSAGNVRPWRRGAISSAGRIAPGAGTGYDPPEEEKEKPEPMFPAMAPVKFCIRRGEQCEGHFPASEDSDCCPWCRVDLRTEADLNHLDPSLPEPVLIETLRAIATLDSKIVLHHFASEQAKACGAQRAARHQRARAILRSRERAAIIAKAAA